MRTASLYFLQTFFVRFIEILLVFPLSILIHHYLPVVISQEYEFNFFLAVALATAISVALFIVSRKLLLAVFILITGFMVFNKTFNEYSFEDLNRDYNTFVLNITDDHQLSYFQPIEGSELQERKVYGSVQHQHPVIRNYSLRNSVRHFDQEYYKKHGKVVRYFSLYKHIRENWKYVHDPRGVDYYATAIETLPVLAGDCDDYAILMASTIMAIGGDARIIITKQHMYAEVKVGTLKDMDEVDEVVRSLFPDESKNKKIHYHATNNELWINFDYTDHYPGSKFQASEVYNVINF